MDELRDQIEAILEAEFCGTLNMSAVTDRIMALIDPAHVSARDIMAETLLNIEGAEAELRAVRRRLVEHVEVATCDSGSHS